MSKMVRYHLNTVNLVIFLSFEVLSSSSFVAPPFLGPHFIRQDDRGPAVQKLGASEKKEDDDLRKTLTYDPRPWR